MKSHAELMQAEIQSLVPTERVWVTENPMTENLSVRIGNYIVGEVSRTERRMLVESDKTGWDAYGVTGTAADFMILAMALDRAPAHRIPPKYSGTRLSEQGRLICRRMVEVFPDPSRLPRFLQPT